MRVSRARVLQSLLDLFPSPRYLEVGIARGITFHKVTAATKTAVDPRFRFDVDEAKAANGNASYHQLTSDAFFATCPIGQQFDVVYIDGLHTFEQTLRDLMNTLSHITAGSIIVIDDIFPSSFAASLPGRAEFEAVLLHTKEESRAWMGDVYKLVLFIDTFMQSWSFRCVADNHGQLVMWQAPRERVSERMVSDIGLAGYERAIVERESFSFAPFAEIIAEIRRSRAEGINRPRSTG